MTNYDDEFDDAFEDADAEFKKKYQKAIDELKGLSQEELDGIAPTTADKQAYELLIATVKDATEHNIALAEFRNRIKKLGQTALKIVDKIPSLKDIIK